LEAVSAFIDKLHAFAERQSSLEEKHNAVVACLWGTTSVLTGHRPVIAPYDQYADVDVLGRVCFANDKEVRSGSGARLINLTEFGVGQFERYWKHLRELRLHLKYLNNEAVSNIDGIFANQNPFFFVFEGGEIQPFRPEWFLKRTRKHWPFPDNYHRHFLRSYLTREQVNGELISAHIGHCEYGKDCYGPHSGLARSDFAPLLQVIEQLENELELKDLPIWRAR